MKILKLRFKNLNSLFGEWSIDFTAPEFLAYGIFAITGPTGAGKSTILDAICLALYGRTPRLKSITKTGNEIISRQTGECFSEVTFATQAGQFRCHWSQRKARKKSEGNLTDSVHEIADSISGRILESKKRDVARAIEEKTGMDFDRFTRSMLLAQGGFAAFLQASPDERAPILEQITGTEIYSKISKRVHDIQRSEHSKLEILQVETAGIVILNEEDEAGINQTLTDKQKAEKELSIKKSEITKSILWLNGIATLNKELAEIEKEADSLSNKLQLFEADRIRLQKALKAAGLDSEYITISLKREQQKRELENLANIIKQLSDQENSLALRERELKRAEEALLKVKNDYKIEMELIKKVRTLDFSISEKNLNLKAVESECTKIANQIAVNKEFREKSVEKLANANNNLLKIEAYLSENFQDANLVTDLTGINEQIKSLQAIRSNCSEIEKQVTKLKKQFETEAKNHSEQEALCAALKKSHEGVKKEVQQISDSISKLLAGRLLREYRTEHENHLREMVYLKKILKLEDERAKLEDGKPCPLCGSLLHPFAEGNIPEIDDTEKKIKVLSNMIQKAENLEANLKNHENKEKEILSALLEAEKKLVMVKHKQDETLTNIGRYEREEQTILKKSNEQKEAVVIQLKQFGIIEIPDTDLDSISKLLYSRMNSWQDYQKKKRDIEKQTSELTSEIKSLDGILLTLGESFKERQVLFTELKKDYLKQTDDRNSIYGKKNPDQEESMFDKQIFEAEKSEKADRENLVMALERVSEFKTRLSSLQESTGKRKDELKGDEILFESSLIKSGFDDEETFRICRLNKDEKESLSIREKELDLKRAEIAAKKNDRKNRLSLEIELKVTDKSMNDLNNEQLSLDDSIKAIGEEIGAIKQKLIDNTDAKVRHTQKRLLIETQESECSRWDGLHKLIGSADGKKYRNFAQGLTFELLVSHANRQLEKMTDRYLLIRDDEEPLELNVIDNYQAGEIRSTKNLSGGECFIVSLSLALGLSNMASHKVRVDSLFLDEGFGMLDEDALEMALETLCGLQNEGKLIGIISHVPALKERIGTRIIVQPVSGGKSIIKGPGCMRRG